MVSNIIFRKLGLRNKKWMAEGKILSSDKLSMVEIGACSSKIS